VKHHALQYEYPTPPTVARFDTAEQRDAYIAARSGCRRPIGHEVSPRGFHRGAAAGLQFEFRLATVDDLAPPVTALRDSMIDRLREAAVSPQKPITIFTP
jgi:hypothetical protein